MSEEKKYDTSDHEKFFKQVESEMEKEDSGIEIEATSEIIDYTTNIDQTEAVTETEVAEASSDSPDFGLSVSEVETTKDSAPTLPSEMEVKLEKIARTVEQQELRAIKAQEQKIKSDIEYALVLRDQAIDQGNKDLVKQYDKYIDELKTSPAISPVVVKNETTPKLHPEEEKFIERNRSWILSEHPKAIAMQAYTRSRVFEIQKKQPTLSPASIFSIVEKEIVENFAKTPKSESASDKKSGANLQTKGTTSVTTSVNFSAKDLSRNDREIYETLSPKFQKIFLEGAKQASTTTKQKVK